jgi:hypothetical protein
MKDTKNDIIETLKVVKREKGINEGMMKDYDIIIQMFLTEFVKEFLTKFGTDKTPEMIETWSDYLHERVGQDVFKIVSDEIMNMFKKGLK